MLYSPLEQFDLIYLTNLREFVNSTCLFYTNSDLLISNLVIFLIFVTSIFVLIGLYLKSFSSRISKGKKVKKSILKKDKLYLKLFSSSIQYIFEVLFSLIIDMVYEQLGKKGMKFVPIFFVVFLFILLSNLLGMLPFGFTITGHLSITFFLALSFNIGFLILGFYLHGFSFVNLFIPAGVPSILLPIIVIIEVLSYLMRTFSLSIRLFANMMAGHCLLFVTSSFVSKFFSLYGIITIVPIICIYLAIFILEFAIVFLQAYVFTILLVIYLNDAINPGH